jgi:hypothetical protein
LRHAPPSKWNVSVQLDLHWPFGERQMQLRAVLATCDDVMWAYGFDCGDTTTVMMSRLDGDLQPFFVPKVAGGV